MKKQKTDYLLLGISVLGFLTMSVSFCLMPLSTLGFLPGILFWAGLLLGAVLQLVLELRRRAFYKKYRADVRKMQKPRNGLLSFCSGPVATAADITTAAGLIGSLLALVLTGGTGSICYVLIGLTVFAFCMHCVFNGRILFFLNNYHKIQRVLEEKKVSNQEKGEGKK